jgi:hypothetical protein
MNHNDFKYYYNTLTKLTIDAIQNLKQFLCYPICLPSLYNPCPLHCPLRTLFLQYIVNNHVINHISQPPLINSILQVHPS